MTDVMRVLVEPCSTFRKTRLPSSQKLAATMNLMPF